MLDDRVRHLRGPLPDLVVAPAPDEPVDGRRAARERAAPQDERPVVEHAVEPEAVDVRPGRLRRAACPLRQVVVAPAQLGRRLRIGRAQEMADAVGLVVGHQSRPLAGDPLADRLELVQLAARREPDVVVLVPVRPENPAARSRAATTAAATTCPAARARAHAASAAASRMQAPPSRASCRRPTASRRQVDARSRCPRSRRRASKAQLPRRHAHQTPTRGRGDHERDQHLTGAGVVTERGNRRRARCRRAGACSGGGIRLPSSVPLL